MWRRRLPLETETAWFVLVNVLDVVLTAVLISRRGFVESNPIARFFLHHWGLSGMNYFKFAIVAFVTVTAQVIAHWQIRSARLLLNAGTVIVGAVVVYSMTLLTRLS